MIPIPSLTTSATALAAAIPAHGQETAPSTEHVCSQSSSRGSRAAAVRFAEPIVHALRSFSSSQSAEVAEQLEALFGSHDWSPSSVEARVTRLEDLVELSHALPPLEGPSTLLAHILVMTAAALTAAAPPGRDPRFVLFNGMSRDRLAEVTTSSLVREQSEELLAVMGALANSPPEPMLPYLQAALPGVTLPELWQRCLADSEWSLEMRQALGEVIEQAEASGELPVGSLDALCTICSARLGEPVYALAVLQDWLRKSSPEEQLTRGYLLVQEIAEAYLGQDMTREALIWLLQASPTPTRAQLRVGELEGQVRALLVDRAREQGESEGLFPCCPVPAGPGRARWERLVRQAIQGRAPPAGGDWSGAEQTLINATLLRESCPLLGLVAIRALVDLPVKQLQALTPAALLLRRSDPSMDHQLKALLGDVDRALTQDLKREWEQCRNLVSKWNDAQSRSIVTVLADLFLRTLEMEGMALSLVDKGLTLRSLLHHAAEGRVERMVEIGVGSERLWEAIDQALIDWADWEGGGLKAAPLRPLQMALVGLRAEVTTALAEQIPLRRLMHGYETATRTLRELGDQVGALTVQERARWAPAFVWLAESIVTWKRGCEAWTEALKRLRGSPEDPDIRSQERQQFDALRHVAAGVALRSGAIRSILELPSWPGISILSRLFEQVTGWGRLLRSVRQQASQNGRVQADMILQAPEVPLVFASVQRAYLHVILHKRGLDGALCSLAYVPQSLLLGQVPRVALGANSDERIADCWALTLRLATEQRAFLTTQAMVMRAFRGLPIWSDQAMELCRRECGEHVGSRGEPRPFRWPRLEARNREGLLTDWQRIWSAMNGLHRRSRVGPSSVSERVFALELLRHHTSRDERRSIYRSHGRTILGSHQAALVVRAARLAGFGELVKELEEEALALLGSLPRERQEGERRAPAMSTMDIALAQGLQETLTRFMGQALS